MSAFTKIRNARVPTNFGKESLKNTLLHKVDIPTEKATFGMSCFWAPDPLYGTTVGVLRTRVGYAGGTKENPTYKNLGDHTEVIQMEYDPTLVKYETLLKLFWENHEPSAVQKPQYTSLILYHSEEQRQIAEKSMAEEQKKSSKPFVTKIRRAERFYDAEDYHQKYRLQKHPNLCEAIGCKGELLKESYLAARLNGYVIGGGGVAQFEEELPILGLDKETAEYVRKLVTEFEGQSVVC